MLVVDMRISKWMCGKTRQDKIRHERIRGCQRITPIDDNIRYIQLILYDRIMNRLSTMPIRRCLEIQVSSGCRWGVEV